MEEQDRFDRIYRDLQMSNDKFKRIEQALELASDNIGKLMEIAKVQLQTAQSHEERLQRLEKSA